MERRLAPLRAVNISSHDPEDILKPEIITFPAYNQGFLYVKEGGKNLRDIVKHRTRCARYSAQYGVFEHGNTGSFFGGGVQ